jgi:hypothetical protein
LYFLQHPPWGGGLLNNILLGGSTFLLLFISSFFASSLSLQHQDSEAIGSDVQLQAILSPALEVSAPSNCSLGNIDVLGNTLNHCDLMTTVSTNNPTGYTLSLNTAEETTTSNDNQCLRHASASTTACTSVSADKKFSPVGTNVPVASFGMNTWGISVDNSGTPTYGTYNSIPSFAATGLTLRNTTSNAITETTTTRIGAKGDLSLMAGVYTQNALLTVTLNERPVPSITSISPTSGAPGTTIALTGTNFNYGGNPLLYQVMMGDKACENLTITNATTATCDIPSFELAGEKAVLGISVYGDVFSSTATFTYAQEPVLPVDRDFGLFFDSYTAAGGNFGGSSGTFIYDFIVGFDENELDLGNGESLTIEVGMANLSGASGCLPIGPTTLTTIQTCFPSFVTPTTGIPPSSPYPSIVPGGWVSGTTIDDTVSSLTDITTSLVDKFGFVGYHCRTVIFVISARAVNEAGTSNKNYLYFVAKNTSLCSAP